MEMEELGDCFQRIIFFYLKLENHDKIHWCYEKLIILYQRFPLFHDTLSSALIIYSEYFPLIKSFPDFIRRSQLKYGYGVMPLSPTILKRYAVETDDSNILDQWYLHDMAMVKIYNECGQNIANHIRIKYLIYHEPRTSMEVMVGLSVQHPNDMNLTIAQGYGYGDLDYGILVGWIHRKEYDIWDIIQFINERFEPRMEYFIFAICRYDRADLLEYVKLTKNIILEGGYDILRWGYESKIITLDELFGVILVKSLDFGVRILEDRNNITLLQLMMSLDLSNENYYRVAEFMYNQPNKREYCYEFILWLVHTGRLNLEDRKKLSCVSFDPIIDSILDGTIIPR